MAHKKRDPYSTKPVNFKRLTSGQLTALRRAQQCGRLGWRDAFTLLRRGLVILGARPSTFEALAGCAREVSVTEAGKVYLDAEEERLARLFARAPAPGARSKGGGEEG